MWPSAPLPSVLRPLEIGTQKAPDWSTELRVGERPVGKKKEGLNKQRELEQHFPTVAMETGVTVPHACRLHTPPTKRMLQNWSLRLMDVCVCVCAPPGQGANPSHTHSTLRTISRCRSAYNAHLYRYGGGGNRGTWRKPPKEHAGPVHARQGQDPNLQPWRCRANVLTIKPPRHNDFYHHHIVKKR